MVWKKNPFRFRSLQDERFLSKPFEINEACFIRKTHKCNKVFSASKSCFVACPNEDDLEPILELITEKLSKVGIETIIAVKERAYGQDIFCTKICGKIIESKFCIVILDDFIDINKNINIPNPNVYYEYGLMTALGKHIIPLQKENLKLAFNIQSYDTIKYNSKNIGSELDRAIRDAIKITESSGVKCNYKEPLSETTILRKFEMEGFKLRDTSWFLYKIIDDTNFKGFGQYNKSFYLYLGKIDIENDFENYLEDLGIVLYRTNKEFEEKKEKLRLLGLQHKELKDKQKLNPIEIKNLNEIENDIKDIQDKLNLMSKIYIGFIINKELDNTEFIRKAKGMISKYNYFELVYNENTQLEFGDIKVKLTPLTS